MPDDHPPLFLKPRAKDSHKGNFGRVLLIGGSRGMAGSITLSSMAALRTGSGLVSAAVPESCLRTVAGFNPCVMTIPLPEANRSEVAEDAASAVASNLEKMDAIGVGPGMRTGSGATRVVERLLHKTSLPRCMDADALNVLAELDWLKSASSTEVRSSNLILTPHPGELARLVEVSPSEREKQLDAAQDLASRTGAVVVVKGGPTVVVSADARHTNTNGNPGMATAGCGDVLTGMLTSLLGQGFCAWDAARLGVWIHGKAGDLAAARLGEAGLIATDLLEEIPQATQLAVRAQ